MHSFLERIHHLILKNFQISGDEYTSTDFKKMWNL